MRFLKSLLVFVGVLAVVLLGVAFLSHNQSVVVVDLLFLPALELKLGYGLAGSFIAGGFLGMLFSLPVLLKEKATRRRVERRMQNNSKIISEISA